MEASHPIRALGDLVSNASESKTQSMLTKNLISQPIVVKHRPPWMYQVRETCRQSALAFLSLKILQHARHLLCPLPGTHFPRYSHGCSYFHQVPYSSVIFTWLERSSLTIVSKVALPTFQPFVLLYFSLKNVLTTCHHIICLFVCLFIIYILQYKNHQTSYKESDSKYFKICRPHGLFGNY